MFMGSSPAQADEILPGSYSQQDQSVMGGIRNSIVDMGAAARAATDRTNVRSRADMSRSSSSGVNVDFQFGSSQSEQSWKAVKTPDKAPVPGLVAGDCRGDNSSDAYRKQMGQSREGFMKEALIPNSDCGEYHPTLK
ncbi:MAG: hypothetical protein HZA02_07015 [Nitrospinae bacterium]|nr:hypothetical protein [Nitrospinota bacterium]